MQFNNPFGWAMILTMLAAMVLMPIIWHRRNEPGGKPLLGFLIGIVIWSFSYAFDLFSSQLNDMLFWYNLELTATALVVGAWLIFSLEFTNRTRNFSTAWLYLLALEPVLLTIMLWTNPSHGLVYRNPALQPYSQWVFLHITEYGPIFWLNLGYSYLLMGIAIGLIVDAMLKTSGIFRRQMMILLIGVLAPWITNLFTLFRIVPVDLTPAAFALTAVAIALSISNFHLFSVLVIARDLLVESMDDAMLVLDRSGIILDANLAALRLFGSGSQPLTLKSRRPVIGKLAHELFSDWLPFIKPLTEGDANRTERNVGTAEAPQWYELRAMPIHSTANRLIARTDPTGYVLTAHNIQVFKENEEIMALARDQALQTSALKTQLIANVSHDLRTPLNAILGYGTMLVDGVFGPIAPQQSDVVQQMLLSTQQVTLFINDLIDEALIERGKLTLSPSTFAPEDLVGLVRALTNQTVADRGLYLTFDYAPNLSSQLYGDLKRLQQVMMNLVTNAIKYTDKGSIAVRLYDVDEDEWAFEVVDTGPGIPEEMQASVFEPYQRLARETNRRKGGAGLGLAIVKTLVNLMGGNIELQSKPGEGCTFRVTVPLHPRETS